MLLTNMGLEDNIEGGMGELEGLPMKMCDDTARASLSGLARGTRQARVAVKVAGLKKD
jgi:hypothetical protein